MDNTQQEIEVGKALVVLPKGTELEVTDYVSDEEMDEEESKLSSEVKRLEALNERIRVTFQTFSDDLVVDPTVKGLIKKNEILEESREEVSIELMALSEKIQRVRDEIDAEDGVEDDAGVECENEEENKEEVEDEEEKEQQTTRNIRRLCKALFHKIAGKTHPDRTKDKDLIQLFMEAKRMYERFNLEALKDIWEALKGGNPKRSRIRARIEALRNRIDELNMALANATNSPLAALLNIANTAGLQIARMNYRGILDKEARGQIDKLNRMHKEADSLRESLAKLEEILARKRAGEYVDEFEDEEEEDLSTRRLESLDENREDNEDDEHLDDEDDDDWYDEEDEDDDED